MMPVVLAEAPQLLIALEQSPFAAAIRQSTWAYPAANVGHILALLSLPARSRSWTHVFSALSRRHRLRPGCVRRGASQLAVSVLEKVAHEALNAASMQPSDVDWLIPHQANIRIMQGTAKKLKLPLEKMVVTVDQHGNTSAASIPLTLDQAMRDGRIRPGHTVLMEGVGGGFTWGAALVRM